MRLVLALPVLAVTSLVVGSLVAPVSAAESVKTKKFIVCSWSTEDKDATYDCSDYKVRNGTVTQKLPTCWNAEPVGAVAQELVGGAWRDRPDIPVALSNDTWNCESGYTNAATMSVTVPIKPAHKTYTYRVYIPEREGWQAAEGIPQKMCTKPLSDDFVCKG